MHCQAFKAVLLLPALRSTTHTMLQRGRHCPICTCTAAEQPRAAPCVCMVGAQQACARAVFGRPACAWLGASSFASSFVVAAPRWPMWCGLMPLVVEKVALRLAHTARPNNVHVHACWGCHHACAAPLYSMGCRLFPQQV